jgi:hypothetical protein
MKKVIKTILYIPVTIIVFGAMLVWLALRLVEWVFTYSMEEEK